jgi:hypothetical protein
MPNYSIQTKRFFIHHDQNKKQLSPKQAAMIGNVSVKTVYKWIAGTQSPTESTIELMQIKVFGLILGLPDWRFINGLLWCKGYDRPFPPHSLHIMAMLTHRQQYIDDNRVADSTRIAALERELREINDQFLNMDTFAPSDFTPKPPLFARSESQSKGNRH